MNRAKIATGIFVLLLLGGLIAYFLVYPAQHQFTQTIGESPDGLIHATLFPSGAVGPQQSSTQFFYRNTGASTTLLLPDMQPDMELGLPGTRIILPARADSKEIFSFNAVSWIFVEKNNAIHAEHIYGVEFLHNAVKSDTPKLVPGGVIYTDTYGTERKFFLADLATIKNIAEPSSLHFVKGSDAYLADNRTVYFLRSTGSGPAFDPATFSISPIPRANPLTFVVLSTLQRLDLAVDDHSVYLRGEDRTDIDRATFRTLKADYSYRDANGVYVITGPTTPTGVEWTLEKHTLANLEKKIDSDSIYYSTEAHTVFVNKNMLDVLYNGKVLERTPILGADPNTFVQLTGLLGYYTSPNDNVKSQYIYARDSKRVYYNGIPIVGATVDEFQPLENGWLVHSYGVDRTHVYYRDKLLSDADPLTFLILWEIPKEGCAPGEYSKDRSHVYFKDKIVIGANPESFHVLIGEEAYGADDKNVYKQDGIVSGADPKTFMPVCNYG